MSILVVGSVAYDTVNTPSGSRKDSLGGSAMYFSISSSYFTKVSLLAVVGDDFEQKHVQMLESHKVDVSGLERRSGKTFRWSGVYGAEDVNTRSTLDTQLNVFAEFSPKLKNREIPDPYHGEEKDFEEVLDMIELASRGLVDAIGAQLG